ncbi:hypothetical protein BH10ACI2_BH10ACI2_13470 [soil metagenome]
MAAVNAYLSFAGNCESAFEFYKSNFGSEYAMLAALAISTPVSRLVRAKGQRSCTMNCRSAGRC